MFVTTAMHSKDLLLPTTKDSDSLHHMQISCTGNILDNGISCMLKQGLLLHLVSGFQLLHKDFNS